MAELARIHGLKKQRVFQIRNELIKFKLIKNVRRTQTVGDVEGSVVGG
jgi:soluble P-type ATPase